MSRAKDAEMACTHTDETQAPGAAAPFEVRTLAAAMRAAWVGAYRGLASQGWERATNEAYSHGTCYWRYHGRCCAVGWLIPDAHLEHRADAVVGGGVSTIESNFGLLAPPLAGWLASASEEDRADFVALLHSLQYAHDNNSAGDKVRAAIEDVGRRHNLGPLPTLPPGCAS